MWIDVKERLPKVFAGKFKVKLSDGRELFAYFYQDAMAWTVFYGHKSCHWWDIKTHEALRNVMEWKDKEIGN